MLTRTTRRCRFSASCGETHVYSRAMVEMCVLRCRVSRVLRVGVGVGLVCVCVQQSFRQMSKAGASKQARPAAGELVADDADADPRPCRYSAISFETSRVMVEMSCACVQQSLSQISKAGGYATAGSSPEDMSGDDILSCW